MAWGSPSGPYNHVYAIDMECWMRSEAGQFDRARALVIDMMEKAERYGFEFWQGFGHTVQSRVDSDSLLRSAEPDAEAVTAQIDIVTQFTDLWRSVGLFAYQTHYDCIIGQLLTAAGRRDEAQTRINTALQLADDTGMHFFDAELLRARAHTHSDPDTRAADLGMAIQLARQQDAPLFELRAALDDFGASRRRRARCPQSSRVSFHRKLHVARGNKGSVDPGASGLTVRGPHRCRSQS